jgi:hypothetical protein
MARRRVGRRAGSRPTQQQHPTGRRRVKPVGETVNGRLPSSWRRPTQPRVAFRCLKLEAKSTEFYGGAATLSAAKKPPRGTNQSGHRSLPRFAELQSSAAAAPAMGYASHKTAFCVCDSWDKIEIATPAHACGVVRNDTPMSRRCPSQAGESNEDRSDDLRPGPRRLPGTRP